MSRHGYADDLDDVLALGRWRGRVASAIRGKRGQAFLREMRDALDAMPEKRLIAGKIVCEGECCAIGSVALARGMDVSKLDPEDSDGVAAAFGIAEVLVREVAYENDEYVTWIRNKVGRCDRNESPEGRWQYMRKWVEKRILDAHDENAT